MQIIISPDVNYRTLKPPRTRGRFGFLGLLLVLLATACTPMRLTPITPVMAEHHYPGQVVWHDLLTNDVDGAKKFYARLFGWTYQQHGRYTLVLNAGVPIAGMVPDAATRKQSKRSWWVVYLSIADVDGTAQWVEEFGGKVIKGPAEMVGRGRYVMIGDPQGAPLVLLHSATGDPIATDTPPGGWLWDELWTSDTDAALAFYQPLGGYAAQRMPLEEQEAYWVLMSDERWQAGVTTVPFEDVPPQWVPVIRVSDTAAVAARVPSLGGRVVVKPDHHLSGGSVALIEDPTGGIVMVESWKPQVHPNKERQ